MGKRAAIPRNALTRAEGMRQNRLGEPHKFGGQPEMILQVPDGLAEGALRELEYFSGLQ